MSVLRRRTVLAGAVAALCSMQLPAWAQVAAPTEIASALPGARLQGSGRLRVLLMSVYDARLWSGAQPVADDWAATPLALEIDYARALTGSLIAERSLDEMRRQREIDTPAATRWLGAMQRLFPDVRAGDRLTGMNLPGFGVRFLLNGGVRGEVAEPEFARLFFGIWLSPQSSEPALRQRLLGRSGS